MNTQTSTVDCRDSLEFETQDAVGNEYRYQLTDCGAVVTRCRAHAATVEVPAAFEGVPVVEIAPEAFAASEKFALPGRPAAPQHASQRVSQTYLDLRAGARNGQLERVVLPEGVIAIGRAAFRGCGRLSEVALPNLLESIDDLAFSCTALKAVRLPRACVRLAPDALRTGPETVPGAERAYRSKIEHVEVEPENPVYCIRGGLLCRRIVGSDPLSRGLEVVFCPGRIGKVELAGDITRVAPEAFEGTYEIGELRIADTVEFDEGAGPVSRAACGRVSIEYAGTAGASTLSFEMPDAAFSINVLAVTRGARTLDASTIACAYDAALLDVPDKLVRLRLMTARLADPRFLTVERRDCFFEEISANLDALIAHFGARGMWEQYDLLAVAGVLTNATISRAIDVLTTLSDAASVGALLELKRTRFGEAAWDYAL
ncbi:MAG: leucine-rich repeat protein [Eggerthellaceae bacterium]|nr:leucine-rich repeat protein [Eggerthellaceae bacterium]